VVVPHDKLAVQWDTAWEFAVLEGVAPSILTDPEREILERLVRLGEQVPAGVELGYHLCYGDSGHKHFKEPADAAKLVSIANGTAHGLSRRLDWLHLPVPRERFDDAYFAPLAKLALPAHTELYLGLIHYTDGVPGAQRRIDAARKVLSQFGVSTECGLGRRAAETIAPLLDLHTAVAAPRR
jgi:methionine synthase II (cobalamin-independent)